jgi:hypothetical protein
MGRGYHHRSPGTVWTWSFPVAFEQQEMPA